MHVQNWSSPPVKGGGEILKSSKVIQDMNEDKFNEEFWEWSEDHFTVCLDVEEFEPKYFHITPEYEGITIDHPGFDLSDYSSRRLPCQITDGDSDTETFEVVYLTNEVNILNNTDYIKRMDIADSLPAASVTFLPRPAKSDQHMPKRFLHYIKIPDSIFPDIWKDLKNTNKEIES
mmetsp:Transcript_39689/g.92921  ORF Transcript_39689/g.92921 Transcript_39689/m.92921 type:complete len:175 (-) Transcript_39689:30-554(-)